MFYKSFKEIPLWINSVDLIERIYELTKTFPKEERFTLIEQIRRSSISVAGNIAESWGRYFYGDKVRILYIARGEIEEVRSYLAIAKKLRYLNQDDYIKIDDLYSNLLFELNKHKKSLINKNNP